MNHQITTTNNERGWFATRDLPRETLLGCEKPWLTTDESVISPEEAKDWQLTEAYLVRNQRWKKKREFLSQQPPSDLWNRVTTKWDKDMGNLETLVSKLKCHPERKDIPKCFKGLSEDLATK